MKGLFKREERLATSRGIKRQNQSIEREKCCDVDDSGEKKVKIASLFTSIPANPI